MFEYEEKGDIVLKGFPAPVTIYRLLRQGRLPGFRVGSNWRFSREAIEQWERDQAGRAAASPPRRRRAGRHRR